MTTRDEGDNDAERDAGCMEGEVEAEAALGVAAESFNASSPPPGGPPSRPIRAAVEVNSG